MMYRCHELLLVLSFYSCSLCFRTCTTAAPVYDWYPISEQRTSAPAGDISYILWHSFTKQVCCVVRRYVNLQKLRGLTNENFLYDEIFCDETVISYFLVDATSCSNGHWFEVYQEVVLLLAYRTWQWIKLYGKLLAFMYCMFCVGCGLWYWEFFQNMCGVTSFLFFFSNYGCSYWLFRSPVAER